MSRFTDTVHLIGKCIESCKTESQLNICRDMIDTLLVERCKNHVSIYDLTTAQSILQSQIMEMQTHFDNLLKIIND